MPCKRTDYLRFMPPQLAFLGSIQLFPQDPDLLLKVFDDILLVTVDPPSETNEKQLERVHPAILYQPPLASQI